MRILIADDSHLVRRGVVGLLSNEPPCQICGEASNAGETLTKANELRPDIVLLDVSMPGGNGLETARRLRQQIPGIKILMMSQHDPHHMPSHSLEAGADGFVDKGRLATDLLPTIRAMFRT
jgi:two-component system invasion response regulator UvrY